MSPLILALVAAPVVNFSTVRYECAQLNRERDGFLCRVENHVNESATLFVRIYTTTQSPPEKQERTKYLHRKLMQEFRSLHGGYELIRFDLNGKPYEKLCNGVPGQLEMTCEDAYAPQELKAWDWFDNRWDPKKVLAQ